MKKLKLLLFALMVTTCTFKAYSQPNLAVRWVFDDGTSTNGTGVVTYNYINGGLLISASNMLNGSGLTSVGYTQGTTLVASDKARWSSGWTFQSTIDITDYFGFTITAPVGYIMAFDSVAFHERASTTGPQAWQLRTSADGYNSIAGSGPTRIAANSSTPFGRRRVSAGLPSTFVGTIGIRIYGTSATNVGGSWRIDVVRVYLRVISALPIELLSFTGEKFGEDVLLRWSTASEEGNDFFTIFRSRDMQAWQEIAVVPGAGTSQSRIDYQLVDEFPHLGTNYYKLRQTDFDGTFADSHVIAVDFDVGDRFIAFPNPTARGHPIQTSKRVDFVIDNLGRLTAFENNAIEKTGVYTLVHIDENGIQTNCRIVVNTR